MKRRARGFTLIEVLLATALLAAGLALAFATLRSASAMTQRGEVLAQHNERMRAVQGFLRRRISAAQNMAFATDPNTQRQYRFIGEPQRMRFVADLPDYLGRGGPYLHDLRIVQDGQRLEAGFALVQSGQVFAESPPRPPEPLVDGLRVARFQYRGLDEEGRLGPWQERWDAAESLPLQVAVELQTASGKPWPGMIIALAQGTGRSASGTDMAPLP